MEIFLPCEIGTEVFVNKDTFSEYYLHPFDRCGEFAKCEVIGFSITKQGVFMKMKALYASRMCRRGYLRYPVGAIGKTVFLTNPKAANSFI